METLTDQEIREDIRDFEKRISTAMRNYEANIIDAEQLLEQLPETVHGWQAERDLNNQRDFLVRLIKVNQQLIGIRDKRVTPEMTHLTS